jgi:polyketide synthase PksN
MVGRPTVAAAAVRDAVTMALEVLREDLAASLAEALFLEREEIGLNKPFIDMGLDSIVAAEWVRALNARLGSHITVSRVYDYPNIHDLAAFLHTVLAAPGEETAPSPGGEPGVASSRIEVAGPAVMDRMESPPAATLPRADPAPLASGVYEAVAPASGLSDEVLCEALATSLAEALFLEREEVELDKPFIDMGLDSIVAAEWVRTLNTRYGITMTVTRVYDYPTIQTLAIFVRGQLEGHAPAAGAVHITLDDVLQQVQQGHLEIAQAYQLLQQLDS